MTSVLGKDGDVDFYYCFDSYDRYRAKNRSFYNLLILESASGEIISDIQIEKIKSDTLDLQTKLLCQILLFPIIRGEQYM